MNLSSRALKMAHILQKGRPDHKWADNVGLAWKFVHLRKALSKGVATFSYVKKDGSIREACGTLCEVIIPKEDWPKETICDRLPNFSVFNYYDIDKHEWRCFRVTDFIAVQDFWKIEEAIFV